MASRSEWDARHASPSRPASLPDEVLSLARDHVSLRAGSKAADIACGTGRHAVQMAEWGFGTLAVDFSATALRQCRLRAKRAGVDLETLCLDLESPTVDLGRERFDLVAVFNFLHRPLIPILKRSVRPGGIVAYKTFTRKQLEFPAGPRDPRFLLEENELADLFSDFRPIMYRESCESSATAALVARRP